MTKDFTVWNSIKENLEKRDASSIYFHRREIWWCSLGTNIGHELDGKNEILERPVLIVKRFENETALVVPLTTKDRNDHFHHEIIYKGRRRFVVLSQARVISAKRLLRKIERIDKKNIHGINRSHDSCSFLLKSETALTGGISEPVGMVPTV